MVGRSVANFHGELQHALAVMGVRGLDISAARPFDLPDADRPFAQDTEHASYDPATVTRYWQVLSQANVVLEEFAGRFSGKTSPVHHFWHTFDIAVTRFSDRVVRPADGADPVTREAYSARSSARASGSGTRRSPNRPSAPTPRRSRPAGRGRAAARATWAARGGSHLAVLPYDAARAAGDPKAACSTSSRRRTRRVRRGPAGTSEGCPAGTG